MMSYNKYKHLSIFYINGCACSLHVWVAAVNNLLFYQNIIIFNYFELLLNQISRVLSGWLYYYCFQDESVLIWFSGKEEKHLKLSHVSRIISGQRTVSNPTTEITYFIMWRQAVFFLCLWSVVTWLLPVILT